MGKSIRSKRLKRIRTLKRELVEPHYDKKDAARFAALDAATHAPKRELRQKRQPVEMEDLPRGRSLVREAADVDADAEAPENPLENSATDAVAMEVDNGQSKKTPVRRPLKGKGGVIKKRWKSKAKINRDKKRKRRARF